MNRDYIRNRNHIQPHLILTLLQWFKTRKREKRMALPAIPIAIWAVGAGISAWAIYATKQYLEELESKEKSEIRNKLRKMDCEKYESMREIHKNNEMSQTPKVKKEFEAILNELFEKCKG